MKKIQLILVLFFISISAFGQTVNFPGTMQRTVDGAGFKFKFVGGLGTFAITDSIRAASSGGGSAGVISFNGRNGIVSPQSSDYDPFYPLLVGAYNNPTWINTLAYSKITGVPAFITTETDPTVPAYAKSLTAFSVIKPSTDALYEPIFSKNTGFNKNFGSTTGTVVEGNDSRIVNALSTSTAASTYQTLANLSTLTSLGSSNVLYPSQNAVKTYVDNNSLKTVEFYRQSGMTDDEVIQAAIDDLGQGANIFLGKNITYNITNVVKLDKNQSIIGNNSTITRANSTTTTLSVLANNASTSVTVASLPSNWKIGDQLQFYTTSDGRKSSILLFRITNIAGSVITLSKAIGNSVDGTVTSWPIGTSVRKVFPLLTSKYDLDAENAPFTVKNIKFEGNKSNNSQNHYWYVNPVLVARGFQSVIENNYFNDSPNETVIGQGIHVLNNFAYNLNGSFVHISGQNDIAVRSFEQRNMFITGNYVNGVNQIATAITDHSEAAITNSFNGGNVNISNNRFFNGGESIIGSVYVGNLPASVGVGKMIVSDNYFETFNSIIYAYSGGAGAVEGNIQFSGGVFYDCGTVNNWDNAFAFGVFANGMKLSGNTAIQGSTSQGLITNSDGTNRISNSAIIGNKTLDNQLYMDGVSSSISTINSTNFTGSSSKDLAIQNYGGSLLVGSATNNSSGAILQVNGKATVLTAPANSTDVVRKIELDTKQATLVSGTNIATINGNNLLAGGNIVISGGGSQTLDQVLTTGNTSTQNATLGGLSATNRIAVGGALDVNYVSKFISTTSDNYNAFTSTSGTGEYGIYDNALYFQALTLSNGIRFYGNNTAPNPGLSVNASNNVVVQSSLNLSPLTASTLLKLDASKNVANAVSGTDFVIPSGNVATATALATSRNLWGVAFNGTANTTGKPVFTASATGAASINIPQGVAPTSPVNGDVWNTSAVQQHRINGITKTVAYTTDIPSTPTLQQVTTAGSTTTTGASFGNDFSVGNTTADNRIYLIPTSTVSSIFATNNSGSTSKSIALNAPGGNVLVGTTTDNGERLQVNGKLTVSSAPTNPTDVVRLQDINTQTVITKTANYSIAVTDNVIVGETAGAGFTFTLPSAASAINKKFTIMNYSGQTIAINTTGGANEIRRTTGNTNGVNLLASSLGATLSFFSNGTFYYQGF